MTERKEIKLESGVLRVEAEVEAEVDHTHISVGILMVGVAAILLVTTIMAFLFHGNPDVHDLIKALLVKWSQ